MFFKIQIKTECRNWLLSSLLVFSAVISDIANAVYKNIINDIKNIHTYNVRRYVFLNVFAWLSVWQKSYKIKL